MTIILIIIAVVAVMIFFNGLYVGAEFATVGARKTRIRQLAGNGNRQAQRLLPIMDDAKALDDYVATCQLGITISSLALGAFGQSFVAVRFEELSGGAITIAIASTIVLVIFTLLQVVLGELFPKSLAIQFPEWLAMKTIVPIQLSQFVLRPLIWSFNGSARILLRLLGLNEKGGHGTHFSQSEIELLVGESHEGGLLQDEERKLLRNAFRLGDLDAKQVMVHRTQLVTTDINSSTSDVLKVALDAGFSRILVYKDTPDNIAGFVHIKDVFGLKVKDIKQIHEIVRPLVYVPDAVPAVDVWEKLNAQRQYMAVVFDEHGATSGIITQEDLIEEIFGELQDEFDNEDALVKVDKNGRVHLRGDLLITDVNEYLEMNLPHDSADTIGGLVLSSLGRRPKVGDEYVVNDIAIRIEQLDDLRVSEVSLPASSALKIPQIGEWEVERE